MKLHLGIVRKDGKVVNHRSLLKVALNPILRLLGLQIATLFEDEKPGRVILTKCPRMWINSWKYDARDCTIEKKRIWL